MIDYEKLKIVHELATICGEKGNFVQVKYSYNYELEEMPFYCSLYMSQNGFIPVVIGSLDNVIEHLTKFTKPEPKYKVGDEVWTCTGYATEYEPHILTIQGVMTSGYTLTDGEQIFYIPECHLYLTKEALIAAQIAHWTSLQEPYKPEFESEIKGFSDCEHDGFISCRKCNNQWTTGFRVIQKELIEECHHETSGLPHPIIRGAMMEDRKCIKCGAYYR